MPGPAAGPSSSSSPTSPPKVASAQAVAGSDGVGDPYYPTDGNGGYDVTDYRVSISYDPPTKKLDGDTVITATATADLNRFNLDLRGFDVASVEVDDKAAKFERSGEHELVITPPEGLTKDQAFHTRVRYSGIPARTEDATL